MSEYVDFSVEILTDLVHNRGLSGQELIDEFKRVKSEMPNAIDKLAATAKPIDLNSLLEDDSE